MAPKACTETRTDLRARRMLISAAAAVLAACATTPPPGGESAASDSANPRTAAPSALPSQPTQTAPPTAEPPVVAADERRAFGTRHAYFTPATWSQLPGWQDDDLAEAWRAFVQSCSALARKPAWQALCERAARRAPDKHEARAFFEREFMLYEIRNADRTPDGVITGYYEPLLSGSRVRQGAYIHPVYGVPADMLTLDVRLWPKPLRNLRIPARVEGRQIIPMPGMSALNGPYVIDIGNMAADDRDKKLRLRLDGSRLVPYFTRAEIGRQGLPSAPVLAWVDNPAALYSMQIQGSGKVRLADGRLLRLAYAEQNGHPFTPPVKQSGGGAVRSGVTTRGLNIELAEGDVDADVGEPAEAAQHGVAAPAPTAPLFRGGRGTAPSSRAAPPSEVDQMIEQLAGRQTSKARPALTSSGSPAAPRPAAAPKQPAASPLASARMLAAISADPSFVFFREIPDGPGGPIGALGVPLTAGRSVAVDPRTTPLGFPVFLSTGPAAGATSVKRLMMAQDTGGAIRGAVRADYFWGFGAEAYARAAAMKQNGRMWLLMPRGLSVAARDQPLMRSAAGGPVLSDCVIPDDVSCIEDQ